VPFHAQDDEQEFHDGYHDDPVELVSPKRKKTSVLAALVIFAVGGFYLQSTLAANLSINSKTALEFGQGISQTTACSGDTNLTSTPYATFSNSTAGGAHYLASITVKNIPASCNSVDFNISAFNSTDPSPLTLFGSTTSLGINDNAGTFFVSSMNSSYVAVTSTSATCVDAAGTCYGFTLTFSNPSLLASSIAKIVIQSGVNAIKLTCFQNGGACTWVYTKIDTMYDSQLGFTSIAASSDLVRLVAVENHYTIGGSLGNVYVSSNSGASFTKVMPSGSQQTWMSVDSSSDGTRLAAAAYGSGVWISTDSGSTWSTAVNNKINFRSVTMSADGDRLAAVIYGSDIFTMRLSDPGAGWASVTPTIGHNLNWKSITSSSDFSRLAAVEASGDIYTSSNYGASWVNRTTTGIAHGKDWMYIASSSDGTRLEAACGYGCIFGSADSGVTWTSQAATGDLSTKYVSSLTMSADGTYVAAVVTSGPRDVYTSVNSGSTWINRSPAGIAHNLDYTAIASSSDGKSLAALTQTSGLFSTTG